MVPFLPFRFYQFPGSLLGISLGFDAINSEQNKGTLSHVMAQPVPRDYLINAKFTASLYCYQHNVLFAWFSGYGIWAYNNPDPPSRGIIRVVFFILVSIIYVSFWLNLSIFFSVRLRQPATSALSGIAVWLFFTVFYSILVNVIAKACALFDGDTTAGRQIPVRN